MPFRTLLRSILIALSVFGAATASAQKVKLETTAGNIVIALDAANSPDHFGYAVFGKVVSGMDVVDRIRSGATGPGDFPNQPVVIKHATLEK